jgi:hypothetical protein
MSILIWIRIWVVYDEDSNLSGTSRSKSLFGMREKGGHDF